MCSDGPRAAAHGARARRNRPSSAGGEAPAACRYASTDGSNAAGLQVDDDEEDNPMEHLELAVDLLLEPNSLVQTVRYVTLFTTVLL